MKNILASCPNVQAILSRGKLPYHGGCPAYCQGSEVTIVVKDGKVMVDNANVTKTDIKCGNGVIHVIDAVMLPK